MRILLDGVPFGVPDLHFESHANIIVTNAKLQASRWIPSRPPLPRIAREDKSVGVLNGLSYILEFVGRRLGKIWERKNLPFSKESSVLDCLDYGQDVAG
jgi:hypothetical protein